MKFFCEYCGCRIDSDVDDKCPNCGASYKKNETFRAVVPYSETVINRIIGSDSHDSKCTYYKDMEYYLIDSEYLLYLIEKV